MRVLTIMAVVLAGMLAGCQTDNQVGWDYGRAYHTVFENQKLDPGAGGDTPVVGMDGKVATAAYTRYEQAKPTEEEKKLTPILDIRKGQ
jgi:hypothetical protein